MKTRAGVYKDYTQMGHNTDNDIDEAALDVGIYIFTGDPVDYHQFIAAFDELVEKQIDDF